MRYRIIVLGIATISILTICAGALFLLGVGGKLLFTPEEPARPIRVTQIAPLQTQVTITPQTGAKSPPGLVAAAMEQPPPATTVPPTATSTPEPTATSTATATPSPTIAATLSTAPLPTIGQAETGNRLKIPKLSLDTPILDAPVANGTWMVDHLTQTVGHLEGTAAPGSNSNFVLAGHVTLDADTYGPFANLGNLTPGDVIIVYEGDKEFLYRVSTRQTVDRRNVEVVYPSETGEITLITCTNWSSEESRYTDRLVVKGQLIKG